MLEQRSARALDVSTGFEVRTGTPSVENSSIADQPNNPLRTLWNTIGTVGGVVSLASLADDWVEKGSLWKGWIRQMVDTYQGLTHPAFEVLFGWLPWQLPYIVGDYLVIGCLISLSSLRGYGSVEDLTQNVTAVLVHQLRRPTAKILSVGPGNGSNSERIFFGAVFLIVAILIWPLTALIAIRGLFREDDVLGLRSSARYTLRWLAAMLLGLVVLLSFNPFLD